MLKAVILNLRISGNCVYKWNDSSTGYYKIRIYTIEVKCFYDVITGVHLLCYGAKTLIIFPRTSRHSEKFIQFFLFHIVTMFIIWKLFSVNFICIFIYSVVKHLFSIYILLNKLWFEIPK